MFGTLNLLRSVIRGGQIVLHAYRMFKQVFLASFLVSFLLGVLIFGVLLFIHLNAERVAATYNYYIANVMDTLYLGDRNIKISYYFGKLKEKEGLMRVRDIATDSYFSSRKDYSLYVITRDFWISLKSLGVVFGLLITLLTIRGIYRSGEKYQRGAKELNFKKVKKEINQLNSEKNYKPYFIADMPYPYLAESEHTLIMGATGTGKTVLISDLVEQIRKRKGKAIIYDKKCDYIQWFYDRKKDTILNPFDRRGADWNIFKEIEHVGHLKSLAQAFVPKASYQASQEEIWNEAARITFCAILEKLKNEKERYTNQGLFDKVMKANLKDVARLVKGTYAQSTLDLTSPKTASSVMFVIATYFNSLRFTTGEESSSFSIREWLQDKQQDSILFISSREDISDSITPLITAWLEIAIGGLLSLSQSLDRRTWFILDELATLQRIPSLVKAISVARSYGGCFVLGMQNIAQMREVYGQNVTEDISSECNTRCLFKTNNPDTAKWVTLNLGDQQVLEHKESFSYGAHEMRDSVNLNVQEKIKPLFLASEIQNMDKMNLLLKMPQQPFVKAKIDYKARTRHQDAFREKRSLIEKAEETEELEKKKKEEQENAQKAEEEKQIAAAAEDEGAEDEREEEEAAEEEGEEEEEEEAEEEEEEKEKEKEEEKEEEEASEAEEKDKTKKPQNINNNQQRSKEPMNKKETKSQEKKKKKSRTKEEQKVIEKLKKTEDESVF